MATGALQVSVDGPEDPALRVAAAALLGLPLFVALTLAWERDRRGRAVRAALALGGFAVLAAVYIGLETAWTDRGAALRVAHLAVALHLLAAMLPYTGRGETDDFWQYNRILLTRFLLAALYAAVLFVGLALALGALDALFEVEVPGDAYARLWIVVAILFHPWFFLGGLPRRLEGLASRLDYPAALEAFSRFLLVPLTILYLAILTAYLGRVLITRTWPSGWIGWLVSGVSVIGILALLLVHPLREDAGRRWIRTYARWFFVALLPSVAMLLAALWQRIDQYGITEPRYFLGVLTFWLGGTAIYYTITRSREIRWIPATLCVLALLAFAGPWSAYAVSRASQVGRLEGLMREHGVLADGRLASDPGPVPVEDRWQIAAALEYLLEAHGEVGLPAWATTDVPLAEREPADERPAGEEAGAGEAARPDPGDEEATPTARALMEGWGLEYAGSEAARPRDHFVHHAAPERRARSIRGYAWSVRLSGRPVEEMRAELEGDTVRVSYVTRDTSLRVTFGTRAPIELPLGPLLRRLEGRPMTPVPPESLRVEAEETDGPGAALLIRHLAGRRTASGVTLDALDADLLLSGSEAQPP